MWKKYRTNFANFITKLYFGDDDAIYDVIIQEPGKNDVTTTNMESAGIHLLIQSLSDILNHFHF